MLNALTRILPNTFPKSSCYYFSRLTDKQKKVYNVILSGIKGYSSDIRMPIRPINEISKIFNYVLLDNPMIFFVSTSFKQSSDLYKQKCTIRLDYTYTRNEVRTYANEVIKFLRVFDSLRNKSDIDKELYVHDFCLSNFSYDYSFGEHSHSVLGLVLNKTAVCEGIAKFVKLAFDYLGVKSLVVSGKAKNPALDSGMESHAWNIVRINSTTYHLDVTFDMTISDNLPRYDYFNLPDTEVKKDHVIIGDVPACTVVDMDYYTANSMWVNRIADLDDYIGKVARDGLRQLVFKIKNGTYVDGVADKVANIALQQYSKISAGQVSVETSYNASQMVFEVNLK